MDNSYGSGDKRSPSLAMITIYLLDNSYYSGDERSPSLAIMTIYLLDNSYSSFRTLLLYIWGASAAAIYFHATKPSRTIICQSFLPKLFKSKYNDKSEKSFYCR
ncbi:MAG: hypothetical protein F6K17_12720 [Okeania sp. SIO3C4]|nr:hypothetical protein [Okeania sp. SIO3C4]